MIKFKKKKKKVTEKSHNTSKLQNWIIFGANFGGKKELSESAFKNIIVINAEEVFSTFIFKYTFWKILH